VEDLVRVSARAAAGVERRARCRTKTMQFRRAGMRCMARMKIEADTPCRTHPESQP
jgi:hypothetical protein